MKSRDYMMAYVYCKNHPIFKVLVPLITANAYMMRARICPICDAPTSLRKEEGIFKVGYTLINPKKLSKMYANNESVNEIISVKCIHCDGLSFIEPVIGELEKNLEISACPICGSNKLKTNKFYVKLYHKHQNMEW